MTRQISSGAGKKPKAGSISKGAGKQPKRSTASSVVNIRELAFDTLLSITKDGEYSHIALNGVLEKYQYLSKQERSFFTRLCMGTLEHLIWIDYVLDLFSTVKGKKMKPAIRTILRMGVYELKFMDAVPPHATCSEAVKLAQKKGFQSLKGFVNGVLRNVSRSLSDIELPKEETDFLSLRYSMPKWLVQEWLARFGRDKTEEILAAFLEKAPTSVRVNTSRITREALRERLLAEGISAEDNPAAPDGLFLSGYDYLPGIPAFWEGLCYAQDTSSMQLSHKCGVKPGDYVLDVCAAPGGKSIHLAQLLCGRGMVEARDLSPSKVALIQENIDRSGLSNIRACQADARILRKEDVETAELVVADLPCSGLGVIGRKPDIKYRITPEQVKELAALQREILHTVQQYVKPGGTLMYSTCTVSKRENEENVDWFLREHPRYRLIFQEQLLPKAGQQDGFFMAKFQKSAGTEASVAETIEAEASKAETAEAYVAEMTEAEATGAEITETETYKEKHE